MNKEIGLISTTSYLNSSSSWLFGEQRVAKWTAEENKRFENALALFDRDTPDRWHNVAAMIPGKTISDVIKQYRELVEDVSDIEAGLIPVPGYSNSVALEWATDGLIHLYSPGSKRTRSTRGSDHERKKGVPWTEEEHRQLLLGLKKYGKGDWRNISHNFVTTRTPTQVASHAQKYFMRQLPGGKDKRRSSIHDITTVHLDAMNNSPSPDKEGPESPEKPSLFLRGPDDAELTHQGELMRFGDFPGTINSSSSSSLFEFSLHEHLRDMNSVDPNGLMLASRYSVSDESDLTLLSYKEMND